MRRVWSEFIRSFAADCTFAPGVSETSLQDADAALGVPIPTELRSLLLESDGIADRGGNGILSVSQIIARNWEMRCDADQDDLYMPFSHLLLFADAGNGDMFFFPIQGDDRVNRPDVFLWEHETDSRRWIAGNLEEFVTGWFCGKFHE